MPLEKIRLSDELIAWARQAGYACSPGDSDSHVFVLWSDPGGETRFYLRVDGEWISVLRADRAENVKFILAATSLAAVERYLFDALSADVRNAKRLPWIRVPTTSEELAVGYQIVERPDDFIELARSNGDVVARCRQGRLGTMNLVVLSHLYDAPIADVERTYLDPNGRPLFPQTAD